MINGVTQNEDEWSQEKLGDSDQKDQEIPLIQVRRLKKRGSLDLGDGQMWSNKIRLPRSSSGEIIRLRREEPFILWGLEPPKFETQWDNEEREFSPMLRTVLEGNLEKVQQLEIDFHSKEAEEALNLSCKKGHTNIVQYFLENNVNFHFKESKSNLDAISIATYFDKGDVIDTLLSSGQYKALPTIEVHGMPLSLLHVAAYYGSLSAAKALTNNAHISLSVDENDGDYWKPLHYATSRSEINLIQFLLSRKANPNSDGLYRIRPLHIAAFSENVEVINLLLDFNADPSKIVSLNPPRYSYAFELTELEYRTRSSILPPLVLYNAKLYSSLLHWAVVKGSKDLVKKMIDKGSLVYIHDIEGITPLGLALSHARKETIYLFMEMGVKLSDGDKNWRRIVNEESGLKVAKILENTNLDTLDCSNREGFSLLHLAASEGYINLLNRLLSRGVNPNLETVRGETPLFHSVERNHQACMHQLVDSGGNVCHITKTKTSLLHSAAKSNNFSAIDMILKLMTSGKRLDINLPDEHGFTAVYYALSKGRFDIVQRFVQYCIGESVHLKATRNETLLQFYTERNNFGKYDNSIVRVLELEKEIHSTKSNAEQCVRMQLGTTDASTKARETLQAMYDSTRVQIHCWILWMTICCLIMPSSLYFLDFYTDVLLAVEYLNDFIASDKNSTEGSFGGKPIEKMFRNITESQLKVNFLLTLFFILVPISLLALWSYYVHVTQPDIFPLFRTLTNTQRAIIYLILYLPPIGPIFSYVENTYAQTVYLILTFDVSKKYEGEYDEETLANLDEKLRTCYNLKHVAQMRVAINNVLEATLESAFQLILQLYILGTQYQDIMQLHFGDLTLGSIVSLVPTTNSQARLSKQVLSVFLSLLSLTWSFTAYHRFSKLGGLSILWSLPLMFAIFFQIISRAIACTIFALAYTWRIFIVLGVHYVLTIFMKIILEKRTEAPNAAFFNCNPCFSLIRPYFYVILGAFTSTFVYFRIQRPREDKDQLSQRHSSFIIQIFFLVLAFTENILLFGIGVSKLDPTEYDDIFKIVCGVICLVSFIIGVVLQYVYYGCCGHPWVNINGPSFEKDNTTGEYTVSFYKEGGKSQWVFRSCGDCTNTFVEQEDNVYVPRNNSAPKRKARPRLNGNMKESGNSHPC